MAGCDETDRRVRRLGLYGYLGVLFVLTVLITGLTLILVGYHMVSGLAESAAKGELDKITGVVRKELTHAMRQPVRAILGSLSAGPLPKYGTLEERSAYVPALAVFLAEYSMLAGIYVGYENGDFFLVRRLFPTDAQKIFNAPPGTKFVALHIASAEGSVRSERIFFNDKGQLLVLRSGDVVSIFDPRALPWYREAMRAKGRIETVPYLLRGIMEPGMTFSEKSSDGKAVVAVDILLSQLSVLLKEELPTADSCLALLGQNGELIASAQGAISGKVSGDNIRMLTPEDLAPVGRFAVKAYREGQRGRGLSINDGVRDWEVSLEEFELSSSVENIILLAVPRDALAIGNMRFLRYAVLGMAGVFIFFVPFTWIISWNIFSPLRSLAATTGSLQRLLSADGRDLNFAVPEIQTIASGIKHIKENIRDIFAVNHAISSERNFGLLLQRVLPKTLLVTEADGGLLVLLDAENTDGCDAKPVAALACWRRKGKEEFDRITVSPKALEMEHVPYQSMGQGKAIQFSIRQEEPHSRSSFLAPGFADSEVLRVDTVYVLLTSRMGERLGVLGLFRTATQDEIRFQSEEVEFIEIFADTIAIALENNCLLKGQRDLRDALIHILAGAIDAKSPYTGGHCQRVPVIFQMLLEAACESAEGPLSSFSLDEDGWEEAKLAGWLHDCGKITTPEYVADKATKLETIYNRIHEIRTRFEVVKRDAEIACLRAMRSGVDAQGAEDELKKTLRELDDEFAFVASCNIGGEFMDDATLERLYKIAKRTWVRTLDKRLGLSRGELARMDRTEELNLPVVEELLMDRPEHIIKKRAQNGESAAGGLGDFKNSSLQVLYDHGELHNLSIRRGTLTGEERIKINDHVVQTIAMLHAIPLPKHLRNVPEIAGGHHETMNGRGYPKLLTREEMSWSARMLAIADVFEALTACDRPYRRSNTLSEALLIMENSKKENHIDPDLYEMFLKADIPRRYAAMFLNAEQNDL